MSPDVSIVIPSWNGRHLLERFLPSVLGAATEYRRSSRAACEIIIVDDASTDETIDWLEKVFESEVNWLRRQRNGGFAVACNNGFRAARYPLLLLLNNDVEIEAGFIQPLVEHFSDPGVFAATGKVFELDTRVFCNGGKVGRFRHGYWSMYANYDIRGEEGAALLQSRQLLSVTAIGGFSMFDRIKLMSLGGFDELMSPYHWEDIDLSYRGWKRGWEVRYEPRAVGYHNASSTIGAHYRKRAVELVAVRNRLIFHWKNVHSWTMWISHLWMTLFLLLFSVFKLDFLYYRAFWQALGVMGGIRRKRREERRSSKITDVALRQRLAKFYRQAGLIIVRSRKEALQLCEK